MKTITIQTKTMDFVGGIVPEGARYYQVVFRDENPLALSNYYAKAADIPFEKLLKGYGLEHISWPHKSRDMNPDYKGARRVTYKKKSHLWPNKSWPFLFY